MPLISILCPSRGSLLALQTMLDSLVSTTVDRDTIELIARLDDDDPMLPERKGCFETCGRRIPTQVLIGPPVPMGRMTVQMGRAARGAFLWLLNDDITHLTAGWDQLLTLAVADRPRHVFYPDDGLFGSQLACFPLLPKEHVESTGFYGVDRYERYLIDCIISDLYDARAGLNRLIYLPQWKIQHHNAQAAGAIDLDRFHRKTATGLVYQPSEPDMLDRDQARYLQHLTELNRYKGLIVAHELMPVTA